MVGLPAALPDFSYAGYHFGEVPLPEYPVTANVKDFGAQGDGQTGRYRGIQAGNRPRPSRALSSFLQAHYVISDILWLKKPNLVLRGEGSKRHSPYRSQLKLEGRPRPKHGRDHQRESYVQLLVVWRDSCG